MHFHDNRQSSDRVELFIIRDNSIIRVSITKILHLRYENMRHIFSKAKKNVQILLKSQFSAQILLKSQFSAQEC